MRSAKMDNIIFNRRVWKHQVRDALVFWLYIPASVILSGILIDALLDLPEFNAGPVISWTAVSMVISGTLIVFRSMKDLTHYGQGTANPMCPPQVLVRSGVYSLCRHPMFLGYDCTALGVVLLFHSPGMLIFSYPLMMIYEIRLLKKEERILEKRFKDVFSRYMQEVSFLIPGV